MPPGTTEPSGEVCHLTVDPAGVGTRLDLFVAGATRVSSRSYATQLIGAGHVSVSGRPAKPGYRLKTGDLVCVYIPAPASVETLPEALALDILYEDGDILALNKQPGLVVHPAPGHSSGTLVNALLFHCPDLKGIGGELRPGIVHRLDKDTSGVLVVAKDAEAQRRLAAQFKARSVEKEYLALVHGRMAGESGTIDLPIGRHPTDRKRMSTMSRRSRPAQTDWRVAECYGLASLLSIGLKTGRTHQIRVHCAATGHPVVGDPVYGSRAGRRRQRPAGAAAPEIVAVLDGAGRQMLHAWKLTVTHPHTGRRMCFEAPLAVDMRDILEKLRTVLSGGASGPRSD